MTLLIFCAEADGRTLLERNNEQMKRYLIGGAIVLALAIGVFAGSHEGEFTWYKVTGPGPYHVDVVSGHGKTCYVFTEEYGKGNAGEQPVLLWCEAGAPQP
jgi:hypothetical protein